MTARESAFEAIAAELRGSSRDARQRAATLLSALLAAVREEQGQGLADGVDEASGQPGQRVPLSSPGPSFEDKGAAATLVCACGFRVDWTGGCPRCRRPMTASAEVSRLRARNVELEARYADMGGDDGTRESLREAALKLQRERDEARADLAKARGQVGALQRIRDEARADLAKARGQVGALQRIRDACPACGSTTLFIGEGGYLTCGIIGETGCKEPGVSRAIEKLKASLAASIPREEAARIARAQLDASGTHTGTRQAWVRESIARRLEGREPEVWDEKTASPTRALPMRLPCPRCHTLHVDKGEFATKVHHTHACQSCGEVWRPAVVPTVGVEFLPGFKDEPSPAVGAEGAPAEPVRVRHDSGREIVILAANGTWLDDGRASYRAEWCTLISGAPSPLRDQVAAAIERAKGAR